MKRKRNYSDSEFVEPDPKIRKLNISTLDAINNAIKNLNALLELATYEASSFIKNNHSNHSIQEALHVYMPLLTTTKDALSRKKDIPTRLIDELESHAEDMRKKIQITINWRHIRTATLFSEASVRYLQIINSIKNKSKDAPKNVCENKGLLIKAIGDLNNIQNNHAAGSKYYKEINLYKMSFLKALVKIFIIMKKYKQAVALIENINKTYDFSHGQKGRNSGEAFIQYMLGYCYKKLGALKKAEEALKLGLSYPTFKDNHASLSKPSPEIKLSTCRKTEVTLERLLPPTLKSNPALLSKHLPYTAKLFDALPRIDKESSCIYELSFSGTIQGNATSIFIHKMLFMIMSSQLIKDKNYDKNFYEITCHIQTAENMTPHFDLLHYYTNIQILMRLCEIFDYHLRRTNPPTAGETCLNLINRINKRLCFFKNAAFNRPLSKTNKSHLYFTVRSKNLAWLAHHTKKTLGASCEKHLDVILYLFLDDPFALKSSQKFGPIELKNFARLVKRYFLLIAKKRHYNDLLYAFKKTASYYEKTLTLANNKFATSKELIQKEIFSNSAKIVECCIQNNIIKETLPLIKLVKNMKADFPNPMQEQILSVCLARVHCEKREYSEAEEIVKKIQPFNNKILKEVKNMIDNNAQMEIQPPPEMALASLKY